ncbi:endothelin-converting enzyme homolog [Dermacentor variabilis]|uniref:endothelin-converting enzyme homolog n=1 Tax=Dermacentor variabilis TaxID=34621 RepID=UPI003F5B5138
MAVVNMKIVFVLGILFGAGRLLVDKLSRLAFPYCDHPTKCFDYAQELAASVDPRVDPCDSLYDHVCGKWGRQRPFIDAGDWDQFSLLKFRVLSFVLGELDRSPPEHPVLSVRRSLTALHSCQTVYSESREDTKVLFDVFKKFNFQWPSLALPSDFDLMDYLLGMSLEYNLATPALLSLTPDLRTDKRYGLRFEIQLNIDSATFNTEVIASCISSVAPSATSDKASKFAKRIRSVFSDLTAVNALFPSQRITLDNTTVEKLANNTAGHSTGETWLKVINKRLPRDQAIGKSEHVLTLNNSGLLLKTILDNAKRSGYADLVLFAGWNIVVSLRAALSSSLLYCMSGGDSTAQLDSMVLCLGYTNQVAPFAIGRFVVDSLELQRSINYTNNTWNAVKKATRENFANLSWMDQSTAKGAIEHVDSLATVIALPEHVQTNEALDAYYSYLDPNISQPFIQWLFKTKHRRLDEQKRLLNKSTVTIYRDDIDYQAYVVNAYYVPVMHVMAILPAIMNAPFVPQAVPAAIHYGAIGKVLGHELTHAFDPLFSNVTRTGAAATWWSKESFANFSSRLKCLRKQLQGFTDDKVHSKNALSETLADTGGTEKARLAFSTLPAQGGILGYTQEQLFYIAGCFEFCAVGGYKWNKTSLYPAKVLRCNLPARNQERYAAAFSCSKGSPMNPEERCTFH